MPAPRVNGVGAVRVQGLGPAFLNKKREKSYKKTIFFEIMGYSISSQFIKLRVRRWLNA